MRTRSITLVSVVVLAGALLSGCQFNVGLNTSPTVDPETIEEAAAAKLEEQTGVRPEIDCGEEAIPLERDTSITCLLLDPVAGLEFDVVMTFTEVEGTDFAFDIKVADVPNNAPQPTAAPGASVPIVEIEALAIRALTPTLPFVPEVRCTGEELQIAVGNTVECEYDSPEGVVPVLVTVSEFDPNAGTYSIRVTDR